MARTIPTYSIYVDWDNDGGLDFGNFELGTDDWAPNASAGSTTTVVSSTRAHLGVQSLLITWNNVASPKVEKIMTGLIVGRTYTYDAWVFVPTGNAAVRLSSPDTANNGTASAVTNAWTQISVTFTATATQHTLNINVNGTPTNGNQVYMDQVMVRGTGEDVSARTLGIATALQFKYGRDQARSLSAIQPGETSFELNNRSKDYSPDNASSPLFGYVAPGRPVLIRATYNGTAYDLFRGFLDDFTLDPSIGAKSLKVSALDVLQKVADATVTTELFPSLQTGECIHKILDAAGWPTEKRDIDQGATTVRWFWADGDAGLDVIKDLLQSEGPPAFAFVSSAGNFVFRDRHHRLRYSASKTSQGTFNELDAAAEPHYENFTYDIGWRDLANDVTISVGEREAAAFGVAWSTDDVMNIAAGDTLVLPVKTDEPFTNAATPSINVDYTVLSGTVTVTMDRFSGQSANISITANTTAVVQGMQFRATTVPVARTYVINAQDDKSIQDNGLKSLTDFTAPWAGKNDAAAVASMIIGQRSTRLPIVTITVNNANTTRQTHILNRNLSDRITIVEDDTSTNGDFYIEQIEQDVEQVGYHHTATFSSEKVRTQTSPAFTFGVAGKGFDQGKFGIDGIDDSGTVFILGTSLLGTGLLGT